MSFQQWDLDENTRYEVELKTQYHLAMDFGLCENKNCESENQMQLNKLLKNGGKLFPRKKNNLVCVLMVVHNLANPKWIPIDCQNALLEDMMCVVEKQYEVKHGSQATQLACPKNHIIKDGACYGCYVFPLV